MTPRRIGPDLDPAVTYASRQVTKRVARYSLVAIGGYAFGMIGSVYGMKAFLRRKYKGFGLAPARRRDR